MLCLLCPQASRMLQSCSENDSRLLREYFEVTFRKCSENVRNRFDDASKTIRNCFEYVSNVLRTCFERFEKKQTWYLGTMAPWYHGTTVLRTCFGVATNLVRHCYGVPTKSIRTCYERATKLLQWRPWKNGPKDWHGYFKTLNNRRLAMNITGLTGLQGASDTASQFFNHSTRPLWLMCLQRFAASIWTTLEAR